MAKAAGSATANRVPIVPKLKLSTNPVMQQQSLASKPADHHASSASASTASPAALGNSGSISEKQNSAKWNNDNNFSGKLKIKLGPDSNNGQRPRLPSEEPREPSSAEASAPGSAAGENLPFAFAGKPTYSPSRIEPSIPPASANSTVPTKGKRNVDLNMKWIFN